MDAGVPLRCRRGSGSELFDQADPESLTLEPIRGRELVETMKIQRRIPWRVGQAELSARGMHGVMHIAVAHISAGVVADLPTAVARRTDFEQEFLILSQRQELAHAPAEREILARCQVKVFLVVMDFVG